MILCVVFANTTMLRFEGSSRSAWSFSVALSGNDNKRLPTRRSESDGRHERTRFYDSSHTLQSSSVLGTDTYKTQQACCTS